MNTETNPFKPITKSLSDDSLQEIYIKLLKINPVRLLFEDKFCMAIVDEWHYRTDPKH